MYQQIKEAAEAALKLQNKDVMDATLREIVAMCERPPLCRAKLDEFIGALQASVNAGEETTVNSPDITIVAKKNANPTSDPVAEAASKSVASPVTGAGAYCETGDDKPRAPRGDKKSKGAK